jgi:hypothetical protein
MHVLKELMFLKGAVIEQLEVTALQADLTPGSLSTS